MKYLVQFSEYGVRRWAHVTALLFSFFLFVTSLAKPALAQQNVTLVIGSNVGGGYDIYGRLAARHLGRFLPGKPNVVPTNMPGAGQLVMANWFYNIAPKDGNTIGLISGATALEGLWGNPNAHFDGQKFAWLASLNDYTTIAVVWNTSPIFTPDDFFTKQSVVGGAGATSDLTIWPKLLNNILGTKIKLITGYAGTSHLSRAIEAGEVEGMIGDDWDGFKLRKADWIRDKKVRIIMQLTLERHPELQNVPTVMESVKDDNDRLLMKLLLARQSFGRPFAAPPGTPAAQVVILRHAFDEMLHDAEFLSEADKLKIAIRPATGAMVADLIEGVSASPKDVIARAASELKRASTE